MKPLTTSQKWLFAPLALLYLIVYSYLIHPFVYSRFFKTNLFEKLFGFLFWLLFWFLAFVVLLINLPFNSRVLFWLVLSLDQSANAAMGGNIDVTVSHEVGRIIESGRATKFELWHDYIFSNYDFMPGDSHSVSSIERDEV